MSVTSWSLERPDPERGSGAGTMGAAPDSESGEGGVVIQDIGKG